ncbi:MAG: hypothetical protein IK128_03910 [Clostridiales bacterium]|nr:hypothetical protein [Clostridiales bacterium]MBR5358342.1 hypothetical protein [Clostridiales bacterium]
MSQLSRKDIVLIVVTVILFLIMVGGFIFDRNEALLDRTNLISISNDENLEVVKMEKVGFLYSRSSYEAKILVKDGMWQQYINTIQNAYNGSGMIMMTPDFASYSDITLNEVNIKPSPTDGTYVFIFGSTIKESSRENVVYILDQEDDGNSYMYIYYSKE